MPPSTHDRSVLVRRAAVADLPELLPLIQGYWAFEEIPGFDAARVASALERLLIAPNLGMGWIASDDRAPIGYLLGVFVFSLEHGGLTGEIDELYVVPRSRGNGVGAALMGKAESGFRDAGCASVCLQVAKDNEGARRFYARHGFEARSKFELLDRKLTPG